MALPGPARLRYPGTRPRRPPAQHPALKVSQTPSPREPGSAGPANLRSSGARPPAQKTPQVRPAPQAAPQPPPCPTPPLPQVPAARRPARSGRPAPQTYLEGRVLLHLQGHGQLGGRLLHRHLDSAKTLAGGEEAPRGTPGSDVTQPSGAGRAYAAAPIALAHRSEALEEGAALACALRGVQSDQSLPAFLLFSQSVGSLAGRFPPGRLPPAQ